MIRILSGYILTLVLLSVFDLPTMCQDTGVGYFTDLEKDISRPIPFQEELVIDGMAGDWPEDYQPLKLLSDVCGNIPESSDFQAFFRLAWNEKGIILLAEIRDDTIYEDPEQFWKGDGLEFFISRGRGSMKIFQVSVRPGFGLPGPVAPVAVYDHYRFRSIDTSETSVSFYSRKTDHGYLLEGLVPFEIIGLDPNQGQALAVQFYMNDADREEDSTNFSLPWYSVRDSYRNPYAFQNVILSADKYLQTSPELRACIIDGKTLQLKFISDRPCEDRQFKLISGTFSFRFRNIQTKVWSLPLKKISVDGTSFVRLITGDQTTDVLDLGMAYRIFERTEPSEWYEDEIRIFKILDRYAPPPDSATLFTGSSTIRRWYNLSEDLFPMSVINRGFGGSVMRELNRNLDRIVFPYIPSRVIVYEGDNDVARGTEPAAFLEECKTFIMQCHQRLPDMEIYFLSIKPSPSRMRYWKQMEKANHMLKELCTQYEKVFFIDISTPMFAEPGILKNDIYADDKLHLNEKGYSLLRQIITRNFNELSN